MGWAYQEIRASGYRVLSACASGNPSKISPSCLGRTIRKRRASSQLRAPPAWPRLAASGGGECVGASCEETRI